MTSTSTRLTRAVRPVPPAPRRPSTWRLPAALVALSLVPVLAGSARLVEFSAGLRRRRIGWHRTAGRLLVPIGMVVALSAMWMTLFHPWSDGSDLLYVFRLLAGSGMAVSLILGVTAIARRDIKRHGAGWTINLAVVEWFIRRQPANRAARRSAHRVVTSS